jgi:hypothetical protein
MALFLSLTLVFFANYVFGDVYLHMPRGSNNRLDEANRDRNNANRLFDSQNNNRGGANVGSVAYTQGSTLYQQWSQQHSCGAENNDCELIIQYMCDDWLRDGTTTNRIPDNNANCYLDDCDTDLEYGRQESFQYRYNCSARTRNMGLFTANQDMNGNDARYTRQNPNANRYGYECPEERDYYPYWHPSPWVDVAILTNTPTRCADYVAKSENVVGRFYCDPPAPMYEEMQAANQNAWIPINQEECETMFWTNETTQMPYFAEWKQAPAHGRPAPSCTQNKWSRDNHHGNGEGGHWASYNWTMPTDWTHEQCVYRLRYNITTGDFPGWTDELTAEVGAIDWRNNTVINNPNADDDPAEVAVWEEYGLTYDDIAPSFDTNNNNNEDGLRQSREYVLKNNPSVDIFGDIINAGSRGYLKLQMNINTNQFARTFQDRSFRWALRENSMECTRTHNLQVRGKRGNIVQTYPGTEYDFVPEVLMAQDGDCVHFQWTGSNTNPNNNAGQGRAGTDRHNVVQLKAPVYEEGQPTNDPLVTYGQYGSSFPTPNIKEDNFLGFSDADVERLAILSSAEGGAFGGELSELDDAGTYFDLGVRRINKQGVFHYMSTRNNNFSNRGQKAKIVVSSFATEIAQIGAEGGTIRFANDATIVIEPSATSSSLTITVNTDPAQKGQKAKSDFMELYLSEDVPFTMTIPFDSFWTLNGNDVMYSPRHISRDITNRNDDWEVIRNVQFKGGEATFEDSRSGVYVVAIGRFNIALAVFVTFLGVVGLVGGAYTYQYFNPGTLEWLPNIGVFDNLDKQHTQVSRRV